MSEELDYKFDFETFDVFETESNQRCVESNEEEEFTFRLFSGPTEANSIKKISLKEKKEEHFQTKRPNSYYFATSSDEYKKQIQFAAAEYDSLFKEVNLTPTDPWPAKLMSLAELQRKAGLRKHNNRIGLNLRKQRIETKLKLAKAKHAFKHRQRRFIPREGAL